MTHQEPTTGEPRRDGLLQQATFWGVIASVLVGVVTVAATLWTFHGQQQAATAAQRSADFTTAINQIGATGGGSTDVHEGGLYTLGRIIDSDPTTYRSQGCSVVGTFVGEHVSRDEGARPPATPVAGDIRAAMSVLGHSCESMPELSGPAIDLSHANLTAVDMSGVDLNGAQLRAAWMQSAELTGADLSNALLSAAHLDYADIQSASLRSAVLDNAHLAYADLSDSKLTADITPLTLNAPVVDLKNADLHGAVLAGADLTAADVRGAKFGGVDFFCNPKVSGLPPAVPVTPAPGFSMPTQQTCVQLQGVSYDARTVWPRGYTP